MLTHGWLCRFMPDKTEGQMSLCSCKPIDVGVDSEDIYWDCRMGESFVLVNGTPTIQEGESALSKIIFTVVNRRYARESPNPGFLSRVNVESYLR